MDLPKRLVTDITGQTFGGWKVLSYYGPSTNGYRWLCVCIHCGQKQVYTMNKIVNLKPICPCVKSGKLNPHIHIDNNAFTEYLTTKLYSDIPSYCAEVNHALDKYTVDDLMTAYTTDKLPELVATLKGDLSISAHRSSRRKLKIYCAYLQKTDPKYMPSES